jgi:hypothetical protein
MTDEQKREILRQARETLSRPVPQFVPRGDEDAESREWKAGCLQHRRPVREPEREPEPVRLTDTERAHARMAHVRGEIARAIGEEHALIVEIIGETLAHAQRQFEKLLSDQKRAAEAELTLKLTEMRLEIVAKMTATIESMQRVLRGEADRDGVIDLPSWPARSTTKAN